MKAYRIIKWIVCIGVVYTILPSSYFRHFSSSIKRKFSNEDSIFLTFDDGPNPCYTLEILDLLKKYNIKATFFVVAEKAENNKGIIDRIIEENHTLAIHSYSHRSAWLSSPWRTKKDFECSISALNNIGHEAKYFRPPWGIFNLSTQYYARKNGLKSIFWTIITNDWDPDATVNSTVNMILNKVQPGDIIVLHDSNHKSSYDTGAPRNTIKALEIILPTLIKKGFSFKTIEEGMTKKVGSSI